MASGKDSFLVLGEASESDEENNISVVLTRNAAFSTISSLSRLSCKITSQPVSIHNKPQKYVTSVIWSDIEVQRQNAAGIIPGLIVAGEASESDCDTDETSSVTNEAFSSRLEESTMNSMKMRAPVTKYKSLLHKKLRECNVSLHRDICDLSRQTLMNGARQLNTVNQQLLVSQVEMQDTATCTGRALMNMARLDKTLSLMLAVPFLPRIQIETPAPLLL